MSHHVAAGQPPVVTWMARLAAPLGSHAVGCASTRSTYDHRPRKKRPGAEPSREFIRELPLRPASPERSGLSFYFHAMARDGIEPPTRGFSVRCSTN